MLYCCECSIHMQNSQIRKIYSCSKQKAKYATQNEIPLKPRNPFFRAFSQLLKLRFTAMVTYSFQNTLRWSLDADFSGNHRYRNSLLFSHSNKGITEFTRSLSTANLFCLFFTVTQVHHSIPYLKMNHFNCHVPTTKNNEEIVRMNGMTH